MPFSSTNIQTEAYTPNGVTTEFPFYFLALSEDEIQVVLTAANGAETLLTDGFDVVGLNDPAGGYVQFAIAPNYAGQTLSIRAVPSFAQETDFSNQGALNASELNKALDRLAQKIIYLRDFAGVGEGGVGSVTWASVQGKPTLFTPAAHVHAAGDITSGEFAAARIPSLDASKITAGTFDAARIPGLSASKIISGTIDPARLPVQSGGVVSSGGIADLTAPQQALIEEGTLVTTTDGSQWRYSGSGSKTSEASYVELSTATDWAALTSVPPEITSFAALSGIADRLPYFSGADTLSLTTFTAEGRTIAALASQAALQTRASVLTTKGDVSTWTNQPARLGVGTNGQVLTADSATATGLKWANPTGSAGTAGGPPNFVIVFSGNGDGVTSNDAAFTAAEGSAYDRIWLPEGTYLTSRAPNQLLKWYTGPGVIKASSGAGIIPNLKTQVTPVTIVDGDGIDSEYGESSGQFDATEIVYEYIRPGTREYIGVAGDPASALDMYFHVGGMGKFVRFANLSGSSGTNAHLAATAASGATTATLNSSDHGISIGNVIGFQSGDNAVPGDVVTVTNVVGATITFTPALSQTYTVTGTDYFPPYLSGYPASPQVSRGRRTNNMHYGLTVTAGAPGDTYGFLVRSHVSYVPKGGQTHFFDTATVAPFGGDMTFGADGQYGTPWEHAAIDYGFDVGVITVNTYNRTNDTGARGVAWVHDLAKSEGTKPIDVFYLPAGKGRVGLDLTLADFSSDGERAIQMKLNQRIYFDATATGAVGTRARGYWGNVQGDTYITAINDGSDRLDFYAGGVRFMGGRGGSVNFPVQANFSGPVVVANQIAVNEGQTIRLNGLNGNTYFQIVAGNVVLIKNGSPIASW